MDNEIVDDEPLETVAKKTAQLATAADDKTIKAAILVRKAPKRIEDGELGDVKWTEWARKNIRLKSSRLRELQRIANAENPRQELERIRKKTFERVQRHRERKTSAP